MPTRSSFAHRPRTLLLAVAAACSMLAGSVVTVSARDVAAPAPGPTGQTGGGLILGNLLYGFSRPVALTHTGYDGRVFIVEQTGDIEIAAERGGTWQRLGEFLDLTGEIAYGGEQGLLGLAFHPNYDDNGRFYVNYTRRGDGATVVAEYRRGRYNRADPGSKRVVLVIGQPYDNHNGGTMVFGPDRLLYIGMGDGGLGGDPGDRGQDKSTLLGKLLRIDPRRDPNTGRAYRIPADNPFVGTVGRDEIWAIGLRNPWKFSFDRATDDLWLADVGQNAWEEVNHVPTGRGVNFGWDLLEGSHNFERDPGGAPCTSDCKTLPVAEYSHAGGRCAVTGGHVYRGTKYPDLVGDYFFADLCAGTIWGIPEGFTGGTSLPAPARDTDLVVTSFGENRRGDLFVLDINGGLREIRAP